jgi:hypothetical protein
MLLSNKYPCRTRKILKISYWISLHYKKKESSSYRKFTSQKVIDNKIYIAYFNMYCKTLPNFNKLDILTQCRKIYLETLEKFSVWSNSHIESYMQNHETK